MKPFLILLAVTVTSGCSSFQGRPSPVLSMTALENTVRNTYAPNTVMSHYAALNTVNDKRAYRDEVVFSYISAINARYTNYLIGMTSQNKSYNSAIDAITLGLTSGVTIAGQATGQALGAGATFLSGSQGKVNSRLYYEQTLPALLSVMEAERTAVRARILQRLTRDVDAHVISYGMAEALADIGEYESAASIERAVSNLSRQAAENLTEQQNTLANASNERATAVPAVP